MFLKNQKIRVIKTYSNAVTPYRNFMNPFFRLKDQYQLTKMLLMRLERAKKEIVQKNFEPSKLIEVFMSLSLKKNQLRLCWPNWHLTNE